MNRQPNKTSTYELEQLRMELEREKNKFHLPFPKFRSRAEKERERVLLEQINRNKEKNEQFLRFSEDTTVPTQHQDETR